MRIKNAIRLTLSVMLPVAVGAVAGLFTATSVKSWFVTLNKPSFNPPAWVFAPVWTTLYIMMGIAFFLIWQSNADELLKRRAMRIYFLQLFFNFTWSFVFFYAKQPGWALANIVLLLLLIVATIFLFSRISKSAAWLLFPYILWVSFATALNFFIWQLN